MIEINSTDSYGLPLSTSSPIAADRYREGIALMLSAWPSAAELLGAAIEADPDFALAHAALARLDALAARRVEAKTRMELAAQLADKPVTRCRLGDDGLAAGVQRAVRGQIKEPPAAGA